MKNFPIKQDPNRTPVIGDIYMYVDQYTHEYVKCELRSESEDRYKFHINVAMGIRSFVVKKDAFYLSPDEQFRGPNIFYLITKSEDRRGEIVGIKTGIV